MVKLKDLFVLQLGWKNALAMHDTVEDLITLVFSTMDDYRTGKSSTVFRARATELGHLVLSNKKQQSTRFVRSLARGLQAYMRNLPTLVAIIAEKYDEAALDRRNTEARELLAVLSKMRDPRNLLLALGICQLLEIYCEASVQSQHSKRFPTQAWVTVNEMKEELGRLKEKWTWGDEPLKFVDIEAPATVKARLL